MATDETTASTSTVKFNYVKSNLFRVIYADGVYGGASPTPASGAINMAFWNTRTPIPKSIECDVIVVDEKGGAIIGPEKTRETKDGYIREVETMVVMPIPIALSFAAWLIEKLEECQIPAMEILNERRTQNEKSADIIEKPATDETGEVGDE